MAATVGRSVRDLRRHIVTKAFERTSIASTQGSGVAHALVEPRERLASRGVLWEMCATGRKAGATDAI
ncbi:MAG: hypothetical protein ACOYOB_18365 [Myxococcota bacterium]